MCQDLDLFGEVVVTLDDVYKWLMCVPRFDDNVRTNLVKDYILGWDVVNKIKRDKLNGSFYNLKPVGNVNLINLSMKVEMSFPPVFFHLKISTYSDKKRLEKLAFLGKERKKRVKKAPAFVDLPNPYIVKVA